MGGVCLAQRLGDDARVVVEQSVLCAQTQTLRAVGLGFGVLAVAVQRPGQHIRGVDVGTGGIGLACQLQGNDRIAVVCLKESQLHIHRHPRCLVELLDHPNQPVLLDSFLLLPRQAVEIAQGDDEFGQGQPIHRLGIEADGILKIALGRDHPPPPGQGKGIGSVAL